MDFAITYVSVFVASMFLAAPLLLFFVLMIVLLGLVVAIFEKWKIGHSLYWAFITATTVGYGGVRPTKKVSKFLSVIIALVGILFTGMILAISIEVATMAFEKHIPEERLERVRNILDNNSKQ